MAFKKYIIAAILFMLVTSQCFGQTTKNQAPDVQTEEKPPLINKIFIGAAPALTKTPIGAPSLDMMFEYHRKVVKNFGVLVGFSAFQSVFSQATGAQLGEFHGMAGAHFPERFYFEVTGDPLPFGGAPENAFIQELTFEMMFNWGIFYELPLLFKEKLAVRISARNRHGFYNGFYNSEGYSGRLYTPDGYTDEPVTLFGFANRGPLQPSDPPRLGYLDVGLQLDYQLTKHTAIGLSAIGYSLFADELRLFIHLGISF
jgi:hypothetical protein